MPDAPNGQRARVGVLISGAGTNMSALLYASRLPGSPYDIVCVGSNRAAAPGLTLAEAEGIATFANSAKGMEREAHDALMDKDLRDHGCDFVALAGYMRILSAPFVERWGGRMINIHPSLLPKYKGLDTHARAIAAGDAHGGASVHVVTPELDDGPVIAQAKVAILPQDDAAALAARVLIAEHQLYPRALAAFVSGETLA